MDSLQSATTWMRLLAVLAASATMLYGTKRVYDRLATLNQGFGPNSLRAIGIVLFLPVLLILAMVTDFTTVARATIYLTHPLRWEKIGPGYLGVCPSSRDDPRALGSGG
jgi:hypothetical protein